MLTLDNTGHAFADRWVRLGDDAMPPASGAVIVSLARLQAEPGLRPVALGGALGVALPPGGDIAPLLPLLGRVSLIELPFPVFKDGRGFSAARALREQHGFAGDLRATGHVLPDQYVALLRCGITSVALPEGADVAVWRAMLDRHETSGDPVTRALPFLRRAALPFGIGG